MKFEICTTLSGAFSVIIELPVKSWDEVKEWYVKWDTLYYTVDGEAWHEVELNNDSIDAIDWKHPSAVQVYDPETHETIAEY